MGKVTTLKKMRKKFFNEKKWGNTQVLQFGRFKYYYDNQFSPHLIHRPNSILIKFPARRFMETDKPIQKFIWRCKDPRIAKLKL